MVSFIRKEQVAEKTFSFFFDRGGADFDRLPGQYIRMILPHESPDTRGTSRFFTVASSPTKDEIMITTKVIESTFKKTLASLVPDQEVNFFGPLGSFVLDEKDVKPKVFLAGGIGITPFHSMLTYASEKSITTPLALFVSFSKTEEMIFYTELTEIAKSHPNIKVIYTITRPEESKESWTGETGRISMELVKKHVSIKDVTFFVTGPGAMVDGTIAMLKEAGISEEEQIRKEVFPGY
jgi:ferredoxin-NADP reductase